MEPPVGRADRPKARRRRPASLTRSAQDGSTRPGRRDVVVAATPVVSRPGVCGAVEPVTLRCISRPARGHWCHVTSVRPAPVRGRVVFPILVVVAILLLGLNL